MHKMISLDESLALYAQHLRPLAPERRALTDALGQVLAEPLQSKVDLPMFTQSAVDGYALRSADVASASEQSPVTLKLRGEIAAGAPSSAEVQAGCAMRIFTGGVLPAGADTSARQEIVERVGEEIRLRQPVKPGADTRFRGEEVKTGEALASAGQRLNSGLLSALAMAGIDSVMVRPLPRVAVVVTGDEVAEAHRSLKPGEIYDSNGPLVSGWLRERGYAPVSVQRERDEPALLRAALAGALAQADVVLTTGGVSVGDRDYIPELAAELGVKKVFWKVAQKPGKPLWFGVNPDGRALLGFPGNPAAVLIGLHLHTRQLFSVLEGETDGGPRWQHGVLSREVRADIQRDQLLRVEVSSREDGVTLLTPMLRQDSHMLSNLATATGIARIPRSEVNSPVGAVVRWLRM